MKSIRNVAFSALVTLGAFGTVFYTSCTKDACKNVVCQNGGTCASGTCTCTTGYTGTNCETQIRTTFYNTYKGNGSDNMGNTYTNFGLKFYKVGDDAKTLGLDLLDNTNTSIAALTATLQSNSTYNVTGSDGSTTYTGTGSISSTSASLTLTAKDSGVTIVFTFSNMNKQ